jgi:hypothetical protein
VRRSLLAHARTDAFASVRRDHRRLRRGDRNHNPYRSPRAQPVRARAWEPQKLEPDRAGSRRRCSPVPLLAGPCRARDITPRHFLGRFRIADLKVACSSHAGRARKSQSASATYGWGVFVWTVPNPQKCSQSAANLGSSRKTVNPTGAKAGVPKFSLRSPRVCKRSPVSQRLVTIARSVHRYSQGILGDA